jgi:hypothetical protein
MGTAGRIVNEDQKSKGSARIEIVPFPSAHDDWTPVDAPDPDDEPVEAESSVKRSKEATGWAASGLAGALRRSSRGRTAP